MGKLTKAKLVSFLKKLTGESGSKDKGDGFWVTSGKEGKQYSEYSSGLYYVSMDGSSLYESLNYHGTYGWDAKEKLFNFLADHGCWFEKGHSWNFNVYENDEK